MRHAGHAQQGTRVHFIPYISTVAANFRRRNELVLLFLLASAQKNYHTALVQIRNRPH